MACKEDVGAFACSLGNPLSRLNLSKRVQVPFGFVK